jgi:hypothetical protein
MDHSYVFTKRFIDKQVRVLNKPLFVDDLLKNITENPTNIGGDNIDEEEDGENDGNIDRQYDELTPKLLSKILNKTNMIIRKKNARLFAPQVSSQVAHQVVKLEHCKLLLINDQLAKVNALLPPLVLPEFETTTGSSCAAKLTQCTHLISQLPEAKYLLVHTNDHVDEENDEDDEDSINSDTNGDEKDGVNGLIHDDQARVVAPKKLLKNKINQQIKPTDVSTILEEYGKIRQDLIDLNKNLISSYNKLSYLQDLNTKLTYLVAGDTTPVPVPNLRDSELYDSDEEIEYGSNVSQIQSNLLLNNESEEKNLIAEMNRFKILVEKIDYKLNGQNLRGIVTKLNQQGQ